jgi:phage gp29-like protein
MMNPIKKLSLAVKAGIKTYGERPNTEEINTASLFNRYGTYPSNGLTPETLATILKEADEGNISRQMELLSEIQQKDPQIFSCFDRRRRSVLKRKYQVIAADTKDEAYKLHAEFATKVILGIKDFQGVRFNGLDAVGKAFSTQQIMWKIDDAGDPVIDRFIPLDQKNFRAGIASDPKSDLNILRRLTDEALLDGVEIEKNKWFIPIIKAVSGDIGRAGLLRTCTWYYLFKNFDVKAWVQFAELYGLPLRLGKYAPGTGDEERRELLRGLVSIGQDATAIIPDNSKIEFIEAAQKASSFDSFEKLADYCDKQNSKAILGHSASIDSTAGKLGGEDNAGDAIYDLVESDASAFDAAFNDQVIKPLINFKFGIQKYYPTFQTIVVPPKDRNSELDLMNKFQQPISKQYYYETVGIPIPAEGEEVVLPAPVTSPFGSPFVGPVSAKQIFAVDSKKKL